MDSVRVSRPFDLFNQPQHHLEWRSKLPIKAPNLAPWSNHLRRSFGSSLRASTLVGRVDVKRQIDLEVHHAG